MVQKKGLDMRGLSAAFFYAVVSLAIIFFNKAVLSIYKYDGVGTLMLAQMITTVGIAMLMRRLKLKSADFPDFNMKTARELFPMAILFCAKAGTDLLALKLVNIAMYSVLKRMVTPMLIVADYWIRGKLAPVKIRRSVYICVAGTILAGCTDIHFDVVGYLYALLSCVVTAAHSVYIAKSATESQIGSFGLLYYCSVISIPFLLICTALNGELAEFAHFPYLTTPGFQVCFAGSVFLGFAIHFAIYLCTTVNSPLTTSIMGQVKAVIQIACGFLFFDRMQAKTLNIAGMVLSTAGALYYSYLKYEQQKAGAEGGGKGAAKGGGANGEAEGGAGGGGGGGLHGRSPSVTGASTPSVLLALAGREKDERSV
eukprot:tig00021680_g23035.t1